MREYPDYKPSNVPWLGKVPSHWEVWKVTHGFNRIGSGTTPKSDNPIFYDGDIPWVTTSELRETVILDTSQKVTEEAVATYSALKTYPKGSLAIAMYGATIGRLGILGVDATFNQACCVYAEPTVFDTRFVYYWLWMRRPILISLSNGGGQPNLSQDDLKKIWIPIPKVNEQKAIVRFLDHKTAQIDALIAKKQSLLEKLAEQRTALISQAVTKGLDPSVPMKDSGVDWLGEIPAHWQCRRLRFDLKMNPSKSEIQLDDQDLVSFVPMEAVGEYGGLNLDIEKELSEIGSGYTYFSDNDVVVAKITPCFENRKGAFAKGLKNGVAFGTTELHVLRANNNLLPEYLFNITMSHAFAKLGESEMFGAGGQKRVPESFFKDFTIGIPPTLEQQEILNYIQDVRSKFSQRFDKVTEIISRLHEYRAALITNAVTGKIDVRDFCPNAIAEQKELAHG
ncbi:restriction endonuclease subunit S [Paenalcaligenes hermetiae]|uniref:Restriction endonuclease subunit S n=1 Tax=Paenalcaligenes hermetiae TaxID=1157987 RepID=A0ABP9M5C2_9BURK